MSRPTRALPPADYLRSLFDYDQNSGELKWKRRPQEHFKTTQAWIAWNTKYAGKPAGCIHYKGYLIVTVACVVYSVHRVVMKLMTGEEPPETPDHRDGDPSNNRWSNLRPATQREQNWNRRGKKTSASGLRGVYPHGQRWEARINENGVPRHLGMFDTAEEGSAAYERAARELHGEFYRPLETHA